MNNLLEDPVCRLKTLVPLFRILDKQKKSLSEDTSNLAEVARITDCITAILRTHGDAISVHRRAWVNKKNSIIKAVKEFDECIGSLQQSVETSIAEMLKVLNSDTQDPDILAEEVLDKLIPFNDHSTGKLEHYRTKDHLWEFNVIWHTLSFLQDNDVKFSTRRLNRLDYDKKVRLLQKKADRQIPEDISKFFWSLCPQGRIAAHPTLNTE
jgi:hypothetical protein